jgi:hypothetical protein
MTLVKLIVGAFAVFIMIPAGLRLARGSGRIVDAVVIFAALAVLGWLVGLAG